MTKSQQIRAANARIHQKPTTPAVPMAIPKVPLDPDATIVMSRTELDDMLASCAVDALVDDRHWDAEDVLELVEEELRGK